MWMNEARLNQKTRLNSVSENVREQFNQKTKLMVEILGYFIYSKTPLRREPFGPWMQHMFFLIHCLPWVIAGCLYRIWKTRHVAVIFFSSSLLLLFWACYCSLVDWIGNKANFVFLDWSSLGICFLLSLVICWFHNCFMISCLWWWVFNYLLFDILDSNFILLS